MRRIVVLVISFLLVFGFLATGCEKKESNVGKDIKRTMDRAQSAVDKVNQRQKDSVPDEDKPNGE